MKNIKAGKNPPNDINVIIEIPQGGSVKYELNKDSGVIFVDRFAFTAMAYPFNYGFVPETLSKDGDPLDVLVISSQPVYPGCVIPCRPVAMLEMEDEAGIDTKVIAVPMPKVDPFMTEIMDVADLSDAVKNKIKHFFEHYKELEKGKWVKVRDWKDRKAAETEIIESLKH